MLNPVKSSFAASEGGGTIDDTIASCAFLRIMYRLSVCKIETWTARSVLLYKVHIATRWGGSGR